MNRRTLTIITVLGVATGPSALFTANALGSPLTPDAADANSAAQAKQYVDLRSPDARDSGRVVSQPQTTTRVDFRSPDARDSGRVVSQPQTAARVDFRSPDTRDVADGVRFVTLPPAEVVKSPRSNGFEWGDAGIGAGGAALIALLALGTGIAVQHHRRHVPRTRTPLAG